MKVSPGRLVELYESLGEDAYFTELNALLGKTEDEHGFMNIVVPAKLVPDNEEVVKRAPFVLVQGRVENDGAAISVCGFRFKELEVGAHLTHHAHEFR